MDLVERHPEAWREATRHPFLDAVRSGELDPRAFGAWLVQDHHFVRDLLRFQALLLAEAPRADQAVLAAGLVALEAELSWFEDHAGRLRLDLQGPRHPTTEDYAGFLEEVAAGPYAEAIVALWALERAYLEAWRSAAPGEGRYAEFVEHWTVPEFAGYVASLEAAAGRAGGGARAERVFLEVCRLERDFWGIAG